METEASVAVSPTAGWYTDPADAANARWWDGSQWTDEVRLIAPPVLAPVSIVPAVVVPAVVVPAATVPGGLVPVVTPAASAVYVPFQHERAVAAIMPRHGVSYTGAGWWISAQPIWSLAPQGVLLAALSVLGAGSAPLLALISVGVVVASWLLALVFGFADARALRRGGNAAVASPLWMLLSPLPYLILRGQQIRNWDDSPWGALIWWIVAVILSPVFFFLAYFIVLGIVP